MYEVICPECGKSRSVGAKKPWMRGEMPYQKACKSCCQKGKQKSEATKTKLSEAVKGLQTKELLEKKSEFMKSHPEFWKGKLKQGGAEIHWKGQKHSEETKRKISEGVRKAKHKKQ